MWMWRAEMASAVQRTRRPSARRVGGVLIQSSAVVAELATDVEAAKTETDNDGAGNVTYAWLVFLHSLYRDVSFVAVPYTFTNGGTLDAPITDVHWDAHWLTHPNEIGGTFKLSYNGQQVHLSPSMSWHRRWRQSWLLSSVVDSTTGLGEVTVGRRGPGFQGGYVWYVAIMQYPTDANQYSLEATHATLTGIGATVRVSKLNTVAKSLQLRLNGIAMAGVRLDDLQVSTADLMTGPTRSFSLALPRKC